jgi:hypothetical protein
MTWELFTVSGESARQARIEFIRTGLGMILFTAACLISVAAAAAARAVEALFSSFLYRSHLERMTDTRLPDFLPIYARSGLLTLLAAGPAALLMLAWKGSSLVPVWQVVMSVAGGGMLWAVGLFAMKHPLIVEGRRVVRQRFPGARSNPVKTSRPD